MTLKNTPFVMRYLPNDDSHPGYWINMRNVISDDKEEIILYMGLEEDSANSIFDRLNLFLENWLKENFGIF